MFGYLVLNTNKVSPQQKESYRMFYCGLCHTLKQDYALAASKTLSYDMTFVALLLDAIYPSDQTISEIETCIVHPIKKHRYTITSTMHYAAAMNVFLSYYKCLDDWHDDHNAAQKKRADQMEDWVAQIRKTYPQQCEIMEKCLADLNQMEQHNEMNSDLPANCFGTFMQQVFCLNDLEPSKFLLDFSFQLGKFIYLMDACLDLRDDLKNQQYNPLMGLDMTNYQDVLMLIADDMTSAYEKLPVTTNKELLDNILYSGIWSRYELQRKKTQKGSTDERSV